MLVILVATVENLWWFSASQDIYKESIRNRIISSSSLQISTLSKNIYYENVASMRTAMAKLICVLELEIDVDDLIRLTWSINFATDI